MPEDSPRDKVVCRYSGRDFTTDEMALLSALIEGPPRPNRAQLSRSFCERIGWRKPDGSLKDMSARVALLAMQRDGLIALPPPRSRGNRPQPVPITALSEPPLFPPPRTLADAQPLELVRVRGADRHANTLWRELIARYHYLGHTPMVGANIRYAACDRNQTPLAMLGFGAAAWKIAPRDRLIGWSAETREKNLGLIVNNSRLLVLPWVQIPNLISHILALVRRQIAADWQEIYSFSPVLLETFVEKTRFTGTSYKAAGWTNIGTTQGRGRQDTKLQANLPQKDIWIRPLRKDWKRILNR